jgi:hypothetical protein
MADGCGLGALLPDDPLDFGERVGLTRDREHRRILRHVDGIHGALDFGRHRHILIVGVDVPSG